MVSHELYRTASHIYQYDADRFKDVMALYADYLNEQSQFKEAGLGMAHLVLDLIVPAVVTDLTLAYEFVTQFEKAMQAYRAAGCWRESLACAGQAGIPSSEIQALAEAFADTLYEDKDYFNSARLYQDYQGGGQRAARVYCKGLHFAEAIRLIVAQEDHRLLEVIVDQSLAEAMAETTEVLADCKAQIHAQVPRLQELRTKKEEDPCALVGHRLSK